MSVYLVMNNSILKVKKHPWKNDLTFEFVFINLSENSKCILDISKSRRHYSVLEMSSFISKSFINLMR